MQRLSALAKKLLKTRNASAYSAKNAALEFWRKHGDDFPQLAAVARAFLAVDAGSVPVECLFSTTAQLPVAIQAQHDYFRT